MTVAEIAKYYGFSEADLYRPGESTRSADKRERLRQAVRILAIAIHVKTSASQADTGAAFGIKQQRVAQQLESVGRAREEANAIFAELNPPPSGCWNCAHFKPQAAAGYGFCRRYPPTQSIRIWPGVEVTKDHKCGEWKDAVPNSG